MRYSFHFRQHSNVQQVKQLKSFSKTICLPIPKAKASATLKCNCSWLHNYSCFVVWNISMLPADWLAKLILTAVFRAGSLWFVFSNALCLTFSLSVEIIVCCQSFSYAARQIAAQHTCCRLFGKDCAHKTLSNFVFFLPLASHVYVTFKTNYMTAVWT